MNVIDEAQEDLSRGDHVGARDRLLGALRTAPASQPVLELLAYTYLLMGDRPSAGAAWFLTNMSDDDPTASSAFRALEAGYGSPIAIARALPINAPSEQYPIRAQNRLRRLTGAVSANGQEWVPPYDTIYFDDEGVDADDFVDDSFPGSDSHRIGRPMQQRVVASLIILAIVATSASVVLAIVFS